MKSFKKGIALIAVLAFLITAILPISGLAAPRADAPEMTDGCVTNPYITEDQWNEWANQTKNYTLGGADFENESAGFSSY